MREAEKKLVRRVETNCLFFRRVVLERCMIPTELAAVNKLLEGEFNLEYIIIFFIFHT